MGALIRKELRGVLPYILLLLALIFVSFAIESFSGIPHLHDIKDLFNDYVTFSHENAGFTLLLYFALLASLFNREYDDQTLEFLDALPTTRRRVFTGKIIAAWFVVALTNLFDMGAGLFILGLQDNSLLDIWDWKFIGIALVLRMVTGFVMVGWASFFALWRSFGWLIFAVLVMLYLVASEMLPSLKVLNFIGLGHTTWLHLIGIFVGLS